MKNCCLTVSIVSILLLSLAALSPLTAKGGDAIRHLAPITALLFDAREGNEAPLLKSYFDQEIDYFLDIESPRSNVARELYALREAGRSIEVGNFTDAESRIRSLSRFNDHKTYLRGALLAAQGRYESSLEEFRKLIDRRQHLSRNLMSLAFMGAARIFHEVADYSQAIYHYNQVRPIDPQFFQAVFEKSWSLYLNGDMNGSIGATVSFMSPYFDKSFYPEAMIVRAASFYQLCIFDRASDTVESFKRSAEPLRAEMAQLLNQPAESWAFDEKRLSQINGQIMGGLMADREFRANTRAYLLLRHEVTRLQGTYRTTAQRILDFVRSQMITEARSTLKRMESQLRDQLAQADIIQLEILQTGANVLLGEDFKQSVPVKILDLASVDFDEMVQFWPFKKEFWLDELGSHYSGLKSHCDS